MPAKKSKSSSASGGGEIQVQKSPAEFFADNQAIAGFDNMGKSLYTSIRELMENSLDACESIGQLPSVSVDIEELTEAEFNKVRGISGVTKDFELFASKKAGRASLSNATTEGESDKKTRKKPSQEAYFKIRVRDNGCGMKHEAIPELLGRVLSGSKYGVRQTRGKFGLGAKMALIWSKKSTGVPIKVTTSHRPKGGDPPKYMSHCVLDIDITNNCPRIVEHKKQANKDRWVGTELEILIAGNWTTYKSRIVQYLQQLAIITPYAQLELNYDNHSDPKRNMSIRYDRRSEQMPPPAREVKHHPSSVNNLVIGQLMERTKCHTLVQFLSKELSNVPATVAARIVKECGWDEDMEPDLSDRQITKLVQVLRSVRLFKAPDGSCLSPLGEYNLNLGIRKVLEPDFVATARDKPSAYEGHPFVVEAAVSLGGKEAKEGINVVRFANRIPLLFEGGADVSTRVAQTKIKWSSYKMDYKRDKIGVFVSIVSTKIPYKGTGKEYIGDDITEISHSVKRALQSCCQQLRTHLVKRNALRDQRERKSKLTKYIPDVSRALMGLLEGMNERRNQNNGGENSPRKRPRTESPSARENLGDVSSLLEQVGSGDLTEDVLRKSLLDAVNDQNAMQEEEQSKKRKEQAGGLPIYLVVPVEMIEREQDEDASKFDLVHPLFSFRPMHNPEALK